MKVEYKRIESGRLLKYDIISRCSESEFCTEVLSEDEKVDSDFDGFSAVRPYIQISVNELLQLLKEYDKTNLDMYPERFIIQKLDNIET